MNLGRDILSTLPQPKVNNLINGAVAQLPLSWQLWEESEFFRHRIFVLTYLLIAQWLKDNLFSKEETTHSAS